MNFSFVWDKEKADSNKQKHKITFKEASSVFLSGTDILTIYDGAHSEDEDRWLSIGFSASGNLLIVVHTYKVLGKSPIEIRIISSRKATKKEIEQYNEQV